MPLGFLPIIHPTFGLHLDKRQLSVVVHRIGKTLLFDEFDVLAMLLATEVSHILPTHPIFLPRDLTVTAANYRP